MSRIRSIHPGLWTDESFVSCSAFARLLIIGLWNESDDQGVFEWKPLQIKMKLFAADATDVAPLLAELLEGDVCRRFVVDGKGYGAMRNFCKFQRPRKPKAHHPLPAELADYVAVHLLGRDEVPQKSEPVPQKSEIAPQMEDGGCRKDSSEANASGAEPPSDPLKELFDVGVSILTASGQTEKQARSLVGKWRKEKGEADVLAAFLDCRARAISEPVEWLQKRFNGARWVSDSGYEYRGSDRDVLREAERRGDNNTYWSVKRAMEANPRPPPKPDDARRAKGGASVGKIANDILRAAGG